VSHADALLAQLSDPHVRVGGDDGASARALEAAVRAILDLRPAPQAVLVSGDIAEGGDAREYERVRELLAPLPMPVHVLAGNHDDRDALREHFGPPGEHGPLRYTARCGALRLVVCDTTRPGRDDGQLDARQRAWLEAQLAAEPRAPTIVAMHHLPLPIGLPVLDGIGLPQADRSALAELLARAPQVRRVVAGHVHRTVLGSLGGCSVIACTSTHLQARLELGIDVLEWTPEPPAFLLHAAVDGELISHVQPIG
jgi:Icc protein